MKKIMVFLSKELHWEIKVKAAMNNTTMNTWILQAIQDKLNKEGK